MMPRPPATNPRSPRAVPRWAESDRIVRLTWIRPGRTERWLRSHHGAKPEIELQAAHVSAGRWRLRVRDILAAAGEGLTMFVVRGRRIIRYGYRELHQPDLVHALTGVGSQYLQASVDRAGRVPVRRPTG